MTIAVSRLAISPQKVCSFIAKVREFDAVDAISDHRLNGGGGASIEALEYQSDCPTFADLASFIDALTDDERIDLVVLAWLGRGDGTIGELSELREEAGYFHNKRTANYLLAKPMLVDHLKEGLAQFGFRYEAIRPATLGQQASREHKFESPSTAPR